MAKETTKTTVRSACEEYVVEELKQAKKENEQLKEVVKTLKNVNEIENEYHDNLMELVKKALKNAKVKDQNGFRCVYVNDMFVGLYYKDKITKEDEPYVALAKLIEKVERIPERE